LVATGGLGVVKVEEEEVDNLVPPKRRGGKEGELFRREKSASSVGALMYEMGRASATSPASWPDKHGEAKGSQALNTTGTFEKKVAMLNTKEQKGRVPSRCYTAGRERRRGKDSIKREIRVALVASQSGICVG